MKKANSSGTNCTTRREAEELSPRLLEPPGQDQPRSRKTIILFGPKILFKGFNRMKRYVNIFDKEALSKSSKHGDYTKSRVDQERTTTPTPTLPRKGTSIGEARSQRHPQYTGGTLRRKLCAGA